MLSGCGGGGDASGRLDSGESTINSARPEYVGPEVEPRVAFERVNAERLACGWGSLRQSLQLDMAARNHATWQLRNGLSSHEEFSGTPGFTGVTALDRARAAGYRPPSGFVIEDSFVTFTGTDAKVGKAELAARNLFLAPYHALGLLRGYRELGVSVRNAVDAGSTTPNVIVQLDMATAAEEGMQWPAATEVLTYPCQGVTGTGRTLQGESPSVHPSRSYLLHPTGQPIIVAAREGHQLTLDTANVTLIATGTALPVEILTKANDGNGRLRSHEAIVIPDLPLAAHSTYAVYLHGQNAGVAFERRFSFTTGD